MGEGGKKLFERRKNVKFSQKTQKKKGFLGGAFAFLFGGLKKI